MQKITLPSPGSCAPDKSALPSPLTPINCDLRDFAFMPLDVARLRDSDMASEQTPEENWAAVLLWAAAWHQVPAGSIPDSDNWMAKAAGYLSRGRIDPHWNDVKAGAMRGFVLCSDGRWYHQVVCEKANESWLGKLKQRLKTECARIKKHNDRHGTSIPHPEFDAWFAAGCPAGQPLPVPGDKQQLSPGTNSNVPEDTPTLSLDEVSGVPSEGPSKGQGEGQGELTTTTPKPPDGGLPPARTKTGAIALQTFLDACKAKGERPLRDYEPLWRYAKGAGLSQEFIALGWVEFCRRFLAGGTGEAKRYKDWRAAFRKYVEGNYLKLWAIDANGEYFLTTLGKQAQKIYESKEAA